MVFVAIFAVLSTTIIYFGLRALDSHFWPKSRLSLSFYLSPADLAKRVDASLYPQLQEVDTVYIYTDDEAGESLCLESDFLKAFAAQTSGHTLIVRNSAEFSIDPVLRSQNRQLHLVLAGLPRLAELDQELGRCSVANPSDWQCAAANTLRRELERNVTPSGEFAALLHQVGPYRFSLLMCPSSLVF